VSGAAEARLTVAFAVIEGDGDDPDPVDDLPDGGSPTRLNQKHRGACSPGLASSRFGFVEILCCRLLARVCSIWLHRNTLRPQHLSARRIAANFAKLPGLLGKA
jgi:hypothetical protein